MFLILCVAWGVFCALAYAAGGWVLVGGSVVVFVCCFSLFELLSMGLFRKP